jgi:putative inorganic carbon (HCO3(-)) transporter
MNNRIKRFRSSLIGYELWIVGCCVATTFVSDKFLLPVALIIGILAFLRIFTLRKFLRTPIDWGIIGLLVMICITLIMTPLPPKTFPQVLRLLIGIGVFYAIINWGTSTSKLKRAYPIIAIFGLLLAVYGLINTRWITNKIPWIPEALYLTLPQVATDTIHPSVLGNNLVILLPIILAIPIFTGRGNPLTKFLIPIAISVFIFSVLMVSQTRGSILAFICAFAVLIALRWRRGTIAVIVLVALIGIIFAYIISSSPIYSQVLLTDSSEKLSGRVEIWSRAIFMIKDFPFTGVGMGLYGGLADSLYPFFLNAPGSVPHSHNLFLQIAVDLGIPGLISWLSILLIVTISSWKIFITNRSDRWWRGLGAGLLASQVALIVNGMTDSVTWGMVKPAPIVWGVWGLAIATWILFADKKIHEFIQ